jgi:hypothetical protein
MGQLRLIKRIPALLYLADGQAVAEVAEWLHLGEQTVLTEILTQTHQHLILIQDGAKYHTCRATQEFFAAHADRLTSFGITPV